MLNLPPADLEKEGSSIDVPIAIGIAVAEGIIRVNPRVDYHRRRVKARQ